MFRWFAMFALVPAALAAGEEQLAAGNPAPEPGQYQLYEGMEYYCTGPEGQRIELGTVICITASCQTWMARCELSVTNVMWRKLQDGCPGVTLIDRLQQAGAAAG